MTTVTLAHAHRGLCVLQYIVWWAITSLLVIKFLGGQLVARKLYLMQTLRLALTL